jgi:hypothetical protein
LLNKQKFCFVWPAARFRNVWGQQAYSSDLFIFHMSDQ